MTLWARAKATVRSLPVVGPRLRALWRAARGLPPERTLDEARVLVQALGAVRPDPWFVTVGANDGVTFDPTADLLLPPPWRGLLVEPVPDLAARLRANFADPQRFRIAQVAVGAAPARATFHAIDPAARAEHPEWPEWVDQLGSFDRDHILWHLDGALAPYIRPLDIEVVPLRDLLVREGVPRVDFLHVDTEGHDRVVLDSAPLDTAPPVLILVEHNHLRPDDWRAMLGRLRRHGYDVADLGRDFFAVHRAQARALRLPRLGRR